MLKYEQGWNSIRINFLIKMLETGFWKQHSQSKLNFNLSWKSKLSVSHFLASPLPPEMLWSYIMPLIPQMPQMPLIPQMPLNAHGIF